MKIRVLRDPDFTSLAEYAGDDVARCLTAPGAPFNATSHRQSGDLSRADRDPLVPPCVKGNFAERALEAVATVMTNAHAMARSRAAGLICGAAAVLAPLAHRGGTAEAGVPFFVDLSAAANADLEDDGIADNGRGGWTDEGINDMYIYPPLELGELERNGYRFNIIDPKGNGGRSVIVLKGSVRCKDKPESVTVKVPDVRGKYVYFLQNAAGQARRQPKNFEVAVYTVTYADGRTQDIPIRDGIEIRQWWVSPWFANSGPSSWPIFLGRNVYSMKWRCFIAVYACQWKNPAPESEIAAITFTSRGKSTPVIFAVTIADEDYYESPDLKQYYKRPPDPPAGYFDAKIAIENRALLNAMEGAGMLKGLRRVDVIRSDILAVTVDPAWGKTGAGLNEAVERGLARPEKFSVTSGTDADYRSGVRPCRVGRRSYEYWNGNIGPFPQNMIYWHTYYLYLPAPMKSGHSYKVTLEGMDGAYRDSGTLAYDEKRTRTPVIKVNQVAYSSRGSRRYAYLGWWAGDAGEVDYSSLVRFEVIDEETGASVLDGAIMERQAADSLSGEDVYQMDLSALKAGAYHVRVGGLGRSDAFSVGGAAMKDLYFHTMRAFYHQRCGQELAEPYTSFEKPACHLKAYEGGYLVGNPNYAPKPGEEVRDFRGGYHDAADFDCFTYHLPATSQSLTAYEQFPEKFTDGDLNIPESGNGVPDVLDEADWALFFYRDHQRADGAIPLGRGNDQDYIRDWERRHGGRRPPFGILPPSTDSSSTYAAVAAQYARLVRKFDAANSERYLASAKRAYVWGKANEDKRSVAWAAAELFGTTGEETYHRDFKAFHDALRQVTWRQTQIAPIWRWSYVACRSRGVDESIREALRGEILKRADQVVRETERAPYRVGMGRKAGGLGWGNGNGGGYYADPCLRAYWLTHDQRYLDAACLNADFQLGANPLSKTFITDMGSRPPNCPQISAFLYTGPNKTGRTVKGITVYGISTREPKWYPGEIPPWRRWRDLGNGGAEVSSEFTVTQTVGASAMLYMTLYALEN